MALLKTLLSRTAGGADLRAHIREVEGALRKARRDLEVLDDARRNGYPPGQQRAFVIAKVLENARVIIVGSEAPDIVAACKMIPAANMEEALNLATRETGKSCQALIVPHALLTLPVVQP